MEWNNLNWLQIEDTVFKVQQQIYLATKNGDIPAARNLQNWLLTLQESKLLSVKIVTSNSGGKTPGIDQWIALSDQDKFFLVNNLNLDGTSNYIRRTYIPKPGSSEQRPLGIPTIIDRCKQCLCKLVLEPEAEARFESNSFGFRPGRSCIDVVSKIRAHLLFKGTCYVLDTNIKKCFDRMSHQPLLQKMHTSHPIILHQVDAWLRTGIFDKNEITFPTMGTPQGGIISPLLANIALDGMQNYLSDCIFRKYGSGISTQTYFVRYADDLLVLGPSMEVIQYAKIVLEFFLNQMGLELKPEATRMIHTLDLIIENGKTVARSNHFDFLGFRFKQRFLGKHKYWKAGGKLTKVRTLVLIDPSRIQRHKASISSLMKDIGNVKTLIETLNPRITGWCNYFKHSDAKEYGDLPRKMDIWLNTKIRKWIKKTTKLRGKTEKFWKKDTKDWILFHKEKESDKEITLVKYNSFRWAIYDFKAVDTRTSPYQIGYKSRKEIS